LGYGFRPWFGLGYGGYGYGYDTGLAIGYSGYSDSVAYSVPAPEPYGCVSSSVTVAPPVVAVPTGAESPPMPRLAAPGGDGVPPSPIPRPPSIQPKPVTPPIPAPIRTALNVRVSYPAYGEPMAGERSETLLAKSPQR
jgi:hypothetical protein